jgi:hypothetical protein
MMVEIRSYEQLAKAVERAKKLKPYVRYRGWRWFEVTSSDGVTVYTIHFWDSINGSGRMLGECNCKGGEHGYVCYHLVSALAIHLGIESMRRAA